MKTSRAVILAPISKKPRRGLWRYLEKTYASTLEWKMYLVHVLCLNGNCGRMLHLDNFSHWNYEGEISCPNCESTFMLRVKDGQVISTTPIGVS